MLFIHFCLTFFFSDDDEELVPIDSLNSGNIGKLVLKVSTLPDCQLV